MTIRGAINRWKLKRGKGIALYGSTDGVISFSGFDRTDEIMFAHFLTVHFRHRFEIGRVEPDFRYEQITKWLYENCTGERHVYYDPMFGAGTVLFADKNDAFAFRMMFDKIEQSPMDHPLTIERSRLALARYGLA